MRRTPNLQHTPPVRMLGEPEDNTTKFVYQQVVESSLNLGILERSLHCQIHTEIAQEIAAGYASPNGKGKVFSLFADYGAVSNELLRAIVVIINEGEDITQFDAEYAMEILCLEALRRYVWHVMNY